jgi:hypothetical protein
VAANVSLTGPYSLRRVPVVQSSMPLAYNIVADGFGRVFVGSLDGSFSCVSVATGTLQWTVALGLGPLSSAAALCVAGSVNVLLSFSFSFLFSFFVHHVLAQKHALRCHVLHCALVLSLKIHGCIRFIAPAASQGVLVMGRSGDAAMLRFAA